MTTMNYPAGEQALFKCRTERYRANPRRVHGSTDTVRREQV